MPPVAALFGTYFAFVGAFSPFLGPFLAERGMSIVQIGVLVSLQQALRIVGPPCWGWLAAHAAENTLLVRAAAGMLAGCALLAVAQGMGPLAAALVLLFFASSGIMPIAESVALREVTGDAGRYGRLRVWGSIGFVLAVSAGGPLLDLLGTGWLPAWMALSVTGLLWAARRTGRRERPVATSHGPRARIRHRLREPEIAAFFVSSLLMIVAHAGLYAFYSLYLERLGFSKSVIGLMWSLGVVAEIAVFALQRRLFDRFDARRLLAASFLVATLRFAIIGGCDGAIGWLVAAQLMHAVTFGVHHSASVTLLHGWFEPAMQARAQAFNIVAGYGIGGTLGGLLASWVWEALSPPSVFGAAAVAAFAGWLVLRVGAGRRRAARPA